jgi:hypothetical protein
VLLGGIRAAMRYVSNGLGHEDIAMVAADLMRFDCYAPGCATLMGDSRPIHFTAHALYRL